MQSDPDGPLEEVDVARALGISADTLRRLIEDGYFPDAMYVSERTRGWLPEDVKSYLHLRGRIGPRWVSKPPPAKEKAS